MATIIESAKVYPAYGRIDFETPTDNGITTIRVSFEAIEQFYEKVKPHLEYRRKLNLVEGETMRMESYSK